jgi:O-antigen ligase
MPAKSTWRISNATEILAAILLVGALVSIQTLIGGTRLLFALPAYGLLGIIGLLSLVSFRSVKPLPDQFCLWSATIFFGYLLVRATFSPASYLARFDIYSVLGGLVLYFFVACVLTSAKTRMWILACLLAAALAHVFVGVIQFTAGNNFMPISFLQRFDYGRRASGFYICPNHLAGLLEVLGIFGLGLVCWSRWPVWSKLLLGYATVACYAGVILSGSRGGYLSVAASLLVFGVLSVVVLRAAGARAFLRLGIPVAVVAVMAMAAAALLIQRNEDLKDRTRNIVDNKNIRLDLWQAAIEQWKLKPLLGTGSRTYQFYGRQFRTEQMQRDPIYAHSDYLQLLSDYGIVGLGTFVLFLVPHLRQGLSVARQIGRKRVTVSLRLASNTMALNMGALGATAAYLVHSIFDFNLHIPANALLLAFVFGVIANPGVPYDNIDRKSDSSMIFWKMLLPAAAAILLVQAWRFAPGEYLAEKARTALRDNRYFSAIAFASEGLKYENEDPNLFYYLGRAKTLAGDAQADPEAKRSFYEAAIAPFEMAQKLVPLDEVYVLELAFTYDALKRFEEAEWMYNAALALDPKSTSTRQYYTTHLERWQTLGATTN